MLIILSAINFSITPVCGTSPCTLKLGVVNPWGYSFSCLVGLRMGGHDAVLRLTSIPQYFANVIGERLYAGEFGKLRAGYLVDF